MTRFACPRCKTMLENVTGIAVCPGCGQRLQVPGAAATVAEARPPVAVPVFQSPPAPASTEPQIRPVLGRSHVFWNCNLCRGPVDIPVDSKQQSVRCPHCSQRIAVPPVPASALPPPPPHALIPERDTYPVSDPAPPPTRVSRARRDDDWEPDRPRRRRLRRDDYGDDDYLARSAAGAPDLPTVMRSASHGLACSLISLGLLFVALIIWIAGVAARTRPDRQGILVFMIFIVVAVSFVLSLLGTIFSSRGMNPVNESNRGAATGGLVCGIIGLVISAIVGLFVMCVGLVMFSTTPRF
jgi:DNA-directed RNA polymerase subunit RPC12/RpoP